MTLVCWDDVPSEFHYLRTVVEACGETRVALYDQKLGRHVSFIETASDDQLKLIRSAREEVDRRNDRQRIEEWCLNRNQDMESDSSASWHIKGILFLFDQLDNQSNSLVRRFSLKSLLKPLRQLLAPRHARKINLPSDVGVLQHLPDELQYLIGPALQFGKHQHVDTVFDFIDSANLEERKELERVAATCKAGGHYEAVNQFLDEYSIVDYKECANLYFLFGILDYAELEFD